LAVNFFSVILSYAVDLIRLGFHSILKKLAVSYPYIVTMELFACGVSPRLWCSYLQVCIQISTASATHYAV